MKTNVLMIVIFCFTPLATAQETRTRVLYCIDELGAGFDRLEDGTYEVAAFLPQRFTLRVGEMFSSMTVDDQSFTCKTFGRWEGVTPKEDTAPTVCKSDEALDSGSFNIDLRTLRYTRTSASIAGYSNTAGKDDDVMYAGKCEEF